MKIDNKISKSFIFLLLLASAVNGPLVEASELTITNHARSVLKVDVVTSPNGASYCKECLGSPLRGGETRTIVVPTDAFKGAEFFSVVDTTNGFVGESECTNLSVLKNYRLSFYETTAGTRCVIKEM